MTPDKAILAETIRLAREAAAYRRETPAGSSTLTRDQFRLLADIAQERLDSYPATKIVERWNVEAVFRYAKTDPWRMGCWPTETENEARRLADRLRRNADHTCVRVTGPHEHEVPA